MANNQANTECLSLTETNINHSAVESPLSSSPTQRLQLIRNSNPDDMIQNNCRTSNSFVQIDVTHESPSTDIKLEETIAPMSTTKNSINNQAITLPFVDTTESVQPNSEQSDIVPPKPSKKHRRNKNSESSQHVDLDHSPEINDNSKQRSLSSASSSSTNSSASDSPMSNNNLGKFNISSQIPYETLHNDDDDDDDDSFEQPTKEKN